jgi:glycerol uptake facilitator-like aquaporin
MHQGAANVIAQLAGSIVGAGLLLATVTRDNYQEGLACNAIRDKVYAVKMEHADIYGVPSLAHPQYSAWQAFIGETMMTFLVVMVVLRTAFNDRSTADDKKNAPIGRPFPLATATLFFAE